jgi:hypothetical protein
MYTKTIEAYKLFTLREGALFPLYVDHKTPLPEGVWLEAQPGKRNSSGKVISKIGPLAYRPGWHASEFPAATHIGVQRDMKGRPQYRPAWHVWARVELPDEVDWQSIANGRARHYKASKAIVPSTAHITDVVPYGGYYRYKTNANMLGAWLISGNMRILEVLSDEQVKEINDAAGVADLPRLST